jgi:parallel beta-helix repeat protein
MRWSWLWNGSKRTEAKRRYPKIGLEVLEDRVVPATLFVDDDLVQRPDAGYTSIQAAVNAANPGDTIRVYEGTYTEQVLIDSTRDGLTLRSVREHEAVIQAPAAIAAEALVHIDGAEDVTLRGFTIRGPGDAYSNLRFGVLHDNGGSSIIRDNRIEDIHANPFSGAQAGIGIYVGDPTLTTTSLIRDNEIVDYQKGGIVVEGAAASATLRNNTVTGVGPTGVIAQNGIQISDGADALVTHNTVSGNSYTNFLQNVATGILLIEAGEVTVAHNRIFENDFGLAIVATDHAMVLGNCIFDNNFFGMYLENADDSLVKVNAVFENGDDGIHVAAGSSGNTIALNAVVNNRGDGVHLKAGTSDNLIKANLLLHNDGFDARDDSIDGGTAGTANFWEHNVGRTQNRSGLLRRFV